jgi:Fic family protein
MDLNNFDFESLVTKQKNLYRLQELVDFHVKRAASSGSFLLTENLIKELHNVAMHNLPASPGEYRQNGVMIHDSSHIPPQWFEVSAQMGSLCTYINGMWEKKESMPQSGDLIHLAAQAMWRLSYIHPFRDGNGRVARALSYLIMCARHGKLLPAENSVVKQIIDDRKPYYEALSCADSCFKSNIPIEKCTEDLELLLISMLKQQLRDSLKAV